MLMALIASSRERSSIKFLRQSGAFNPSFYSRHCSALQKFFPGGPELHYIRHGWKSGLDPHPGFSTSWYLAQYPDVAAGGINPYIHYLKFGAFEERSPSASGYISDIPQLSWTPVWHYHQAWIGFVRLGITGLIDQANASDVPSSSQLDSARTDAQWYLAKWFFRYEAFEQAYSCLQRLKSLGRGRHASRLPTALAKCALNLSKDQEAYQYVEREEIAKDSINGALIQLSQAYLPAESRLALLNNLWQAAGLATIRSSSYSEAARFYPRLEDSLIARLAPALPAGRIVDGPLVSVIVPVFNGAATLPIALRSLSAQSWTNLEIIVVDDASDDGTDEVVEALTSHDQRITLIRNEVNQGAYSARNKGLAAARGDFVTVHDSDDWSHPQKIEMQVNALLADTSLFASCSSWVRVSKQLFAIGPGHLDLDWVEPNASSYMYRRDVLETLGNWVDVKVSADTEFTDRCAAYYGDSAICEVMPELPLSFSLVRNTSLTRRSSTHSRTSHYGMRHLFLEAARWWHRRQLEKRGTGLTWEKVTDDSPFPIPLGNQHQPELQYDVAVVANASQKNSQLSQLVAHLQALSESGHSVVLFSWCIPDDFASNTLADDVWEACCKNGIAIAHDGLVLNVNELQVQHAASVREWPDRVPQMRAVNWVNDLNGSPLPQHLGEELKSYFQDGGSDFSAAACLDGTV
ncbi:Undecaprenyl-phosphate 4-deoxy-4-formamido-L-arabinose transferase [Carnimonas sp. R-84981]